MSAPWPAAEKSRIADQVPEVQVRVAVALPEMTTLWPFSEQLPETEKAEAFAEFANDPPAGLVTATVGATES